MARTTKSVKKPALATKETTTEPRKYIVQAIEDERFNEKKGRLELKIRWEGFKRASWESRETFTKEQPKMVKDFDAVRKRKAGGTPSITTHSSTTSASRVPKRAADAETQALSPAKKTKKALNEQKKVANTAGSLATDMRSLPVPQPSSNATASATSKPTFGKQEGQEREASQNNVMGQRDKPTSSTSNIIGGSALMVSNCSTPMLTEASPASIMDQVSDENQAAGEDAEEIIVIVKDQAVASSGATSDDCRLRAQPKILKKPVPSVRNVHFHPSVNFASASESRAIVPRQQGAVIITPTTSFAGTMGRIYGEWKQKLDAISALCTANGYSKTAQGWTVDRAEDWMRILLSESCSFSEAASATANQLGAQKRGKR